MATRSNGHGLDGQDHGDQAHGRWRKTKAWDDQGKGILDRAFGLVIKTP